MTDKFEREKISYIQNFEQMRSLNIQMNSIPSFAMILTGGLWFGAGVTQNIEPIIRFLLLFFAGTCNIALVLVCIRTRDVLKSYLEKLKTFNESSFADGKPNNPKLGAFGNYSMITIYAALMTIASVLSFIGAFFFFWPFEFSNVFGFIILLVIIVLSFMLLLCSAEKKQANDI